ncbi:uncharacterized protein LOC142765838 [Rhipicephalus microplus]|uniref:uncharacterized protein LOC142765838 n=1 Tax=Rhipicephalus microplus TaxID=6941 RepID=UPI003F6D90A2
MSGRRYSDADYLSRAPVELSPPNDPNDECFLGIISAFEFAERQRADSELKSLVELLKGYLACSQTSHPLTTAYHPLTNGVTVRIKKTITYVLAMRVDVKQKTWDAILLYLRFAYNKVVQETTQMSSYMLVYGKNPASTLDAMLPNVAERENYDVTVYFRRAEET